LAIRLLLVPIGVGVGIGIGIDSDVYCGWSSRTETIDPADMRDRCTVHIRFLVSRPNLLSFDSDSDSDTDPDPDPDSDSDYNPYRRRDGFTCIEKMSKLQSSAGGSNKWLLLKVPFAPMKGETPSQSSVGTTMDRDSPIDLISTCDFPASR
jgi:hypothetical protein